MRSSMLGRVATESSVCSFSTDMFRSFISFGPCSLHSGSVTVKRCNHTAFIHMLICVVFTLMVQVLLTVRVYAITMKHRVITGFFLIATVFQSGLGIFMTYLAARYSAHPVLEPDFPDGHLCIYNEHRTEEVVYTILSLIFDVAVFILIMTRLLWRRPPSVRIPSIIRTIVKDATLYVLLLCTSRIIFVFLSIFAAGLGHITRFSGNNVFVSIMITRMLISLKKTSAKGLGQGWVLGEKDDSILDPSGSLRVVRDGALSSSHTSHNQLDSVIPIHMEIIHIRGERFHN
ncbi:hypothetical protein BDM02DRAFT_586096 [Thelephora ganbajun]|uniref:Uncharacterized protein n=1 Tax=Thelephora ganbajun TaxID=370292 RepID=A0ACB6Z7J9_THEGA|nr:hypothetical protein BDM02DRAFT_586096 [Thelephora ganbajun]